MIKQRLLGILLIAIGVGSTFIDGDATAAFLIVPLGLVLLFSKNYWLY